MISFNNLCNAQIGVLFVQEEEAAQRQEISRKKSKILTEEMAKVRYCLYKCVHEWIYKYIYIRIYLFRWKHICVLTNIDICVYA